MGEPEPICGLNAVAALFARRPDDVMRLFFAQEMRPRLGPFCAELARLRRPYRILPPEELQRAAGTAHHGGVVAVARPRRVEILDLANPPRHRLLLVLDGVGNPHNLGAIARSAAFFGAGALLLREGPANAMPSPAAYRTAEGGLEHLELFRIRDLPAALAALAPHYRTVAASLTRDALPLADLPRDRAVALVLGNEERGVSPEVLAACRRQVRIPGSGRVQSLNVAQSAAVLLHALS
jgi:RNA methyltransferase, TrmH family